MTTFADFERVDAALARRGIPPASAWWRTELQRFYAGKSIRTWAARVGRGGIKSTMISKVALAEVLAGDFKIPPGERHFFAIVSVSRDEAAQRIEQIAAFLRALKIPHSRAADTIELGSTPRGFKVLACTIAGVSGFRCLGVAGDELAKWRSADDAANPAGEVIASMRAMTVTHPQARALFFSSPLSSTDWHSSQIELGDTRSQIVSIAPTWIANPSITEEQTRELEPDPRIWAREYGAVPQAAKLAAFDPDDVDACFAVRSDVGRSFHAVGVIDASSGKKDRWTWAFANWRESLRGPLLVLEEVGDFGPGEVRELGVDEVVRRVCERARARGVRIVLGDQREAAALASIFARNGVALRELPWTSTSKPRAVARVRRWLLERRLSLPPGHQAMRRELLAFEEKVTANGDFTFGARGSGHDDFVALLVTLALGDEERLITGSPPIGPSMGATADGGRLRFGGPRGNTTDPPSTATHAGLRALWAGDARLVFRDGQAFVEPPQPGARRSFPRSSRLTFPGSSY